MAQVPSCAPFRKPRLSTLACVLCLTSLVLPSHALDLQAHRGGRGLMPENTLAAFENAIRLGVTTLELDIAITADGVPVISHEQALNPAITRDAKGEWITRRDLLIHSLTLAQVQSYDVGRLNPADSYAKGFPGQQPRDGQRIPTLAALFRRVAELGATGIQFNVETKINPALPNNAPAPEAFAKAVLDVVRASGMADRVMLQSFDWRTLDWAHRLAPQLRTAYLTYASKDGSNVGDPQWTAGLALKDFNGSVPLLVRAAGGLATGTAATTAPSVTWSPNVNNLTAELVKQSQALGLQVIPWTVNDPAQMQRLIEWGVDGIITDYPDRLREVMAQKGLALPAAVMP